MDKYVCKHCFDDYAIARFIKTEAVALACDYCGSKSDGDAIAAPFRDVVRFIQEGIYSEWSDSADESLPWDSEDGRYIVRTYDTDDLIDQVLTFESDDLRRDIIRFLGDVEWCQKHALSLTQQEEWWIDWENFAQQLKHHTRYVFYRVEEVSEDMYAPARSLHEILDTIGELVTSLELIRTLPIGTVIVRARPHKETENYSTVRELGPPAFENTVSTRMSPSGIPMFYGCQREDTALSEINGSEFATVANFKTLKDLMVLDLTTIPDVPSLFDPNNYSQRAPLIFLWNFLEDFTKKIEKDGRVHIEYVPTQVVTEYFRRVFKHFESDTLMGIVYPSARHDGGISYVFFLDNESCAQDDEDVDLSDKWLSMESSSVKRFDLRNTPRDESSQFVILTSTE